MIKVIKESQNSSNPSISEVTNAIRAIWNDDNLDYLKSTNDYLEYFKDTYGWNIDTQKFDTAWDKAVGDDDDYEEPLEIDGIEMHDSSDAKMWLRQKIDEYGNTYHFPSEDRRKLDKLIQRFGNTYFWNR